MTTTEIQDKPTTLAEYGELWRIESDGRCYRENEHMATFDRAKEHLTYKDKDVLRRYRIPIGRLLNEAKLTAQNYGTLGGEPVAKDAPDRPKQHPFYGQYTPSLVRWRHKFARDEFVASYGVISMEESDRVEMPVRRRDIDPDYRSPDNAFVTIDKETGQSRRQSVAPHNQEEYGDQVLETERKYPAMSDTVLTYLVESSNPEVDANADPNIKY